MAQLLHSRSRDLNEEIFGLIDGKNIEWKDGFMSEVKVRVSRFVFSWKVALGLSVILNVFLGMHAMHANGPNNNLDQIGYERSAYGQSLPATLSIYHLTGSIAGLERNISRPWTPLVAHNETEQDEIWENTSYDVGQIALSDDYARSKGLPRAQRFPWDKTKGVYLINAYHNIHCVKTIRIALTEFRSNSAQSSHWGHIQHCLLVLRDEVICNADDVPRYTGFQQNRASGQGQYRMCRDFSKLEDWAMKHTACWRHIGKMGDPGFRELDRYRFCPEGSPYKEMSEVKWLEGSSDWWRKYKTNA